MLCSTKCIEAFLHILALQLCLSSALQHWIDVGEGLLHKVHARCLIPSLTSMTPQSLELSSICILNQPVYTLRHCLQMLMECTKTWYITICLCSKKVFKLFDTLYVQCCLPLVVAQGDDTTAVQRRIFQYFTANVLLYKLDVWCSLFVVLPQHWNFALQQHYVNVYCTSLNCCLNGLSCCFVSFWTSHFLMFDVEKNNI